MYQLTAAVVIADVELRNQVCANLYICPVRVVLEQATIPDWRAFLARLKRLTPDLLFIDSPQFLDEIEGGAQKIKSLCPAPSVIVVHGSADAEAILKSIRAGADEVVYPPLEEGMRQSLQRAVWQRVEKPAPDREKGKVVGFFSSKGGCGATTIACHVAVELQRTTKHEILLADCDVNLGMVGSLMKANTPYSILDAVRSVNQLDFGYWKGLVWSAYPRLDVIQAPEKPPYQEPPDPEALRKLVRFVRSQYQWVIADLGRGLSVLVQELLEDLDELFLVSTGDVPALHQAKEIARALRQGSRSFLPLHLILNRVTRQHGFTSKEIENLLGVPVYAELAERSELEDAFRGGRLLAAESRGGRGMAALTMKIANVDRAAIKAQYPNSSFRRLLPEWLGGVTRPTPSGILRLGIFEEPSL
jgi:pilus assembly protein CpaE